MRQTKQRDIIIQIIREAKRPLSPKEILDLAEGRVDSISLATVYRALRAFLDDGAIAEVNLPGDNTRYERAGQDHHHHFQCTECQRAFDLPTCPGDVVDRMAPPGFVVDDHDITLFGRCRDCVDDADA